MNNQVICIYEHSKCTYTVSFAMCYCCCCCPNKWHCITSLTVGNSIKASQTEWKLGLMYRYTVHLRIHFDFECYVDCVSTSQWLQYGHLFVLFMAFSCKTHRARFHFDDYIVASLFLISLGTNAKQNKKHEQINIGKTENQKQSLKRNFNSNSVHSSLRTKLWLINAGRVRIDRLRNRIARNEIKM